MILVKVSIKIIKQFGIYENRRLQNYINSLGEFLVSTSELSNKSLHSQF